MIKRFYIPLPDVDARTCIINKLMRKQQFTLDESNVLLIAEKTRGYSGSDMEGYGSEWLLSEFISTIIVDCVVKLLSVPFEKSHQKKLQTFSWRASGPSPSTTFSMRLRKFVRVLAIGTWICMKSGTMTTVASPASFSEKSKRMSVY